MELVEALASLSEDHPTLRLHFVGWEEDPSHPVRNTLEKRAAELRVLDRVLFHGRKQLGEELWQMYRMADIYVIPSYHEGFPRTIWEAMAHSLPVVATRVGAIPYYLTDKENALLIEPKSVAAIAEGIRKPDGDAFSEKTAHCQCPGIGGGEHRKQQSQTNGYLCGKRLTGFLGTIGRCILFLLFTNWLPDNVIFINLRGRLARPFFKKCGKNLGIGRNVCFYNPSKMEIGTNVYIAYGCWFLGRYNCRK